MRRLTSIGFFYLRLLYIGLSSHQTAMAQSITIGGNDQQILQMLEARGYTNMRITNRGLTLIRAEACRGEDKYLVKVSILGRITSEIKTGSCPAIRAGRFTKDDAVAVLKKNGFDKVSAIESGVAIIAKACKNNRRTEFSFNRRGKIKGQKNLGRCTVPALTAEQIREKLRNEGYRRIVITDNKPPRYVAEACQKRQRIRIEMNNRGVIRSERRIGECGRQFNPDNIVSHLEKQDFDRVEVIDRRRPPYIAMACKGTDRLEVEIGRYGRVRNARRIGECRRFIGSDQLVSFLEEKGYDRVRVLRGNRAPYIAEACKSLGLMELTIGRYGRIRNEERVGRCAPPVTEDSLSARLTDQGYSNVKVSRKRGGGWDAEMCREENKITIRFDAYGDILRERSAGKCVSKTVLDVLKTLESRGAEATRLLIEGCYRGTKYNWSYDRLGNRIGRTAIGGC